MVVTHGIHHGATMALAVTQLRSGQDLHEVELGDFTDVAEAVIAAVDVADIISNDPDGELLACELLYIL
jgi:hypothetical protein